MHRRVLALFLCLFSSLALACGGDDDSRMEPVDAGPPDMGLPDTGPPDAGLEMSYLYGPCVVNEQCPSGLCRTAAEGFPEGYCSAPCEDRGPCMDPMTGVYHECALYEDGNRYCVRKCMNGAGCEREHYSCIFPNDPEIADGICYGMCGADEDCGPGASCNVYSQECVPEGTAPTTGSVTGESCAADADCRSDWCIEAGSATTPSGWNGGYCIGPCILPLGYNTNTFFAGEALPAGTCADDQVCFPNGSFTRGDIGICLDSCTTDEDCRAGEGYYCLKEIQLASGVASYTNGVCLPIDCMERDCPAGYSCRTIRTTSGTDYVCAPL